MTAAAKDPPTLELPGPVAVVGDIHGRAELLAELLAKLGELPIFVVGDVCDRGPDTRGVIDLLIARGARGVRGNHDDWLTTFANGGPFDSFALAPIFGGAATLASYGIEGRGASAVERERRKIPRAHAEWLASLHVVLRLVVGGAPFYLAHAGVAAITGGRGDAQATLARLARTQPADFLWRSQPVEDMAVLDGPVVLGHVPQREPRDAGHAILVDTGCGASPDGKLTAVILPERRFVSTP